MTMMPMDAVAAAAGTMETGRERRGRRVASDYHVRMMTTGFGVVVVMVMMMMMMMRVVDSSSIVSTQDGGHLHGDTYRQDDDYTNIECRAENENCLGSQHCCHGYICSQEIGQESDSEAAGICRRDPNLSSCHSDDQCSHGSQCIDSDQTGQGFCQTAQTTEEGQRHRDWSQHMYHERKGGLGFGCESTSDCKPFTMDGLDRLCCQDVRRGRQGTKRMCDRITGISICIQ